MKGRKPNLTVIDGGTVKGRCPSAPGWFSDQAKAEWKRVAPQLHARGLLTDDTIGTVESYAIAAGQVRELEETMQAEGRMVASEDGPRPHPAFKMQQAAMREARLLAAELALTPHRRNAAAKPESKPNDKWADASLLA